ncbi:MAG: formate dehydrogenase subunit gamma [Hyphomicrobiaceae bacterium]
MGRTEPWSESRAREVIAVHAEGEGPLLPMLHALQETFGHVPKEVVPLVAEALNLSRAEVHGVVTFYHDYRSAPPGRHVIKLCRAEACQSMGCESLVERAEARLNVKCGSTSADGRVTLEPVYCLGLCATAPSALVDGRVVGRLNAEKLDALLDEAQQ